MCTEGSFTANDRFGRRFDMKALTAAHRTLPFGPTVTVKNLDTGETVKVRLNDRGPYRKNRILDLSYAAAKQLNMLPEGEAKVGIVVIGKGGSPKLADRADDEVEPVSGKESVSNRRRESEGRRTCVMGVGQFACSRAFLLKRKLKPKASRVAVSSRGRRSRKRSTSSG